MAGSATPKTALIMGSLLDLRPFDYNKPYSIAGYNKSFTSVGLDFGIKYTFGSAGLGGRLNSSMKPYLNFGNPPVSTNLQFTYNTLLNAPLNITGKVVRKQIKDGTGN